MGKRPQKNAVGCFSRQNTFASLANIKAYFFSRRILRLRFLVPEDRMYHSDGLTLGSSRSLDGEDRKYRLSYLRSIYDE